MGPKRYTQVHRLAVGGMAEVFLARQVGLADFEKLVVVKRILPHLKDDERFVEMFLKEARLAASVKHPNIVDIYEIDYIDDDYLIVMEYISGVDIKTIIKTASIQDINVPVPIACRIIADSLGGLHAAHSAVDGQGRTLGIVHRDIAPNNILVTYSGIAKVIDFGIAKANTEQTEGKTGSFKGNFRYISPEHLKRDRISARSDIFSMGVVLWEFLTLRKLFWGDTPASILVKVLEDIILPPSTYNPEVSPELDNLVLSALERDPDKRIPSAWVMREALLQHIQPWGVDTDRVGVWLRENLAQSYQQRLDLEQFIRNESESELSPVSYEVDIDSEDQTVSPGPAPTPVPYNSVNKDLWNQSRPVSMMAQETGLIYAGRRRRTAMYPAINPVANASIEQDTNVTVSPGSAASIYIYQVQKNRWLLTLLSSIIVLLLATLVVSILKPSALPFSTDLIEQIPKALGILDSPQPNVSDVPSTPKAKNKETQKQVLAVDERKPSKSILSIETEKPGVDVDAQSKDLSEKKEASDLKEASQLKERKGFGYLSITYQPAHAVLKIDDRRIKGPSPFQHRWPAGIHKVVLFADGYQTLAREIRVRPKERNELTLELKPKANKSKQVPMGKLNIISEPGEAEVSLNGKDVGKTPLYALAIPPRKSILILIKRPGYEDFSRTVTLLSGQTFNMIVPLVKQKEPKKEKETVVSPKPEPKPKPKKKSIRVPMDVVGKSYQGRLLFEKKCSDCHKQKVLSTAYTQLQWRRYFAQGRHDLHESFDGIVTSNELANIKAYLVKYAADTRAGRAIGIR